MIKFAKFITIIILSFIAINILGSYCIETIMGHKYDLKLAKAYDANERMVILGASRASHHYIPKILSDSLGFSVYNFGIDGQNIYVHYALLSMLVEHSANKPKAVVIDINSIDINDSPKWNLEKLNILYPYYSNDDSVRAILNDLLDKKEVLSLKYFGLYRHNSNFLSYLKNLSSPTKDEKNGYEPLYNIWGKDLEIVEGGNKQVDLKKILYFEKMISLCEKNNIKLIFSISPSYVKSCNSNLDSVVKTISERYNIPYLTYENDETFLSHKEWFNEPLHLNTKGADVFTRLFAHDIKHFLATL